jgi:RHS repeat-associated protein
MVEEITSTTTAAYHFHYDGNGNVTEITDHLGASVATYRYDAFGNTLVATGTYALTNRYRFSTKPLDSEVTTAPLYYYGYRYYDPVTGRWPSRDPIRERGGVNLYGIVGNSPLSRFDVLGLKFDWQSQEIAPFISHYFQGDGADFDLIKEGYQESVEKLFKSEISAWRKKAIEDVRIKTEELARSCECDSLGEVKYERISSRGNLVSVNKEPWNIGLGFVLGDTAFFQGYDIHVAVHCCSCSYIGVGTLHHSIRDRFEDPLDLGEVGNRIRRIFVDPENPGPMVFTLGLGAGLSKLLDAVSEAPLATPYRITADWSYPLITGGRIEDCPCDGD